MTAHLGTTPSAKQVFFAAQWPIRLWQAFFCFIAVSLGLWVAPPTADLWGQGGASSPWLSIVLGALLVGWLVSIGTATMVLGPLYRRQGIENGGPFREGDVVQILAGPHKGRITRVYTTWQGVSIRVDLGEKEKKRRRDVFSPVQLLKENGVQPEPSAREADPASTTGRPKPWGGEA
jgi:hypothetical protein